MSNVKKVAWSSLLQTEVSKTLVLKEKCMSLVRKRRRMY